MPRKESIRWDTYYDAPSKYLIAEKSEYETMFNDMDKIIKLCKTFGLEELNKITGLTPDSFVINDGSPLNRLAINLQKDINQFTDNIDLMKEAVRSEVRNHKAEEARETYQKVKEEYKEKYINDLYTLVHNWNIDRKTLERSEAETTGTPKKYFTAKIEYGEGVEPKVEYYGDGNSYPPKEIADKISQKEQEAKEFYNKYVLPAEKLNKKYGDISEIPPDIAFSETIVNSKDTDSEMANESSQKETNNGDSNNKENILEIEY